MNPLTNWNGSEPIVTAFSQAIQQLPPLTWLTHQWWFVGALFLIGLALVEAGDREVRR
jgi:hypothetical protein